MLSVVRVGGVRSEGGRDTDTQRVVVYDGEALDSLERAPYGLTSIEDVTIITWFRFPEKNFISAIGGWAPRCSESSLRSSW